MAQDWSMIPLHIRCTDRNKIDPTYPRDDARFWVLSERLAGRECALNHAWNGLSRTVIEYARSKDRSWSIVEIAGAAKQPPKVLAGAVRAAARSDTRPAQVVHKYEEMSEKEIKKDPYLQDWTS